MNFKIMKRQDIKTLNQFVNEPNELKRYILLQLWINQLYSESITKSITNPLTNINHEITNTEIYNIFRDIKESLIKQNDELKEVELSLTNQLNLITVMNRIFNLEQNDELEHLKQIVDSLGTRICNNNNYIDKINSLSENQIEEIRTNERNKSQ